MHAAPLVAERERALHAVPLGHWAQHRCRPRHIMTSVLQARVAANQGLVRSRRLADSPIAPFLYDRATRPSYHVYSHAHTGFAG